jgi:uncharacterized protein (TIGR03435 family)
MYWQFVSITVLVSACAAQSFEVAAIRPNTSGDTHSSYSVNGEEGARLTTQNVSLITLLQRAYDLRQYQVAGPNWLTEVKFDINAALPADVSREKLPTALQSLLKERFQLAFHRETKEAPAYALIVGKGGSKLKLSAEQEGTSGTWQTHGQYKAQRENMAHFCEVLSRHLGRPVIDQTALDGKYDFVVDYDAQDSMAIFVAIEQTLGLRLETKKASIELFVIDRIEKAPTAN